MTERWYGLDLNPDPWAIGPLYVGKHGGKMVPRVGRNNQLHAYKEAIKDLLADVTPLPPGTYELDFYFWRRLDSHDKGKKNHADATNLQKATEDALQGILFDNDRDVREIRSVIVEQSVETRPFVAIRATLWEGFRDVLPDLIKYQIDQPEFAQPDDNAWGGPT